MEETKLDILNDLTVTHHMHKKPTNLTADGNVVIVQLKGMER